MLLSGTNTPSKETLNNIAIKKKQPFKKKCSNYNNGGRYVICDIWYVICHLINEILLFTFGKEKNVPYSWPSVASSLRQCKQHNIIISWWNDGRVVWPVVSKVIHNHPSFPLNHRFSTYAIGVIWRCHHFYVWTRLLFEPVSISFPFIYLWSLLLYCFFVSLQNTKFNICQCHKLAN